MIEYLNAINYKGISEIRLSELGHINVLCGKNNSGKTSILEALESSKESFRIGKKISSDDIEWLKELYSKEIRKYQAQHHIYEDWFSEYLNEYVKQHSVWYSDEVDAIVQDITDDWNKTRSGIPTIPIKYSTIFENIFKNIRSNYHTELIPPKRKLANKCIMSSTVSNPDIKIASRIFHLKNQNLDSVEHKNYKKIYSSFKKITDFYFNITLNEKDEISLYFSKDEKEWIEGESCGLGLADILLMVSISIDSQASFIFIEEPENHLHPEIQKRFLLFIKDIKSKQFILSTHSSVFLDPFLVDKIFYVYYDGKVKVTDETSKSEILHVLGYSVADNLVADMVILTEGPFDIPILQTIFKKMEIDSRYNIKFWPLCGDVMTHLDLSVIAERKNVFALIDSDPSSSISRTRFMKKCKEHGIYCKKLERYSIENYLTLDAIRKVFDDIPEDLGEIKPDQKVDFQIGFSKKNKSIKQKNRKIIEQMSIGDIESTDLFKFCEKIKKNLEKKANTIER
jgi:predicted ATP-dependent endonuclease of OLD family